MAATAPSAVDPALAPTARGMVAILMPGTEQGVQVPTQLGVTISGGDTGLASGYQVAFTFIPQLYELDEQVLAVTGAKTLPATRQSVTTNPATGLTTALFTVDAALAAGAQAEVVAGHLRPRRFPLDLVRDLPETPSSLSGRGLHGARVRSSDGGARAGARTPMGQPWAAEAGVLWQPISWGDGFRYFCARTASVFSVGPGAVPESYRVRVRADAAIVRTLHLISAKTIAGNAVRGSVRDISGSGITGLEWTSHSSLAMGEQLQLDLRIAAASPEGALSQIKHPTVEVLAPAAHRATQRTSYLETVTRPDSAFDAESKRLFG